MEIAVRLEGGLGDCLLGNWFVSAIKEKYTDEELHHNLPVIREYLGLPKKN